MAGAGFVWGKSEKGETFRLAILARGFGGTVEIADAAIFLASIASDIVNRNLLMHEGGFTSV